MSRFLLICAAGAAGTAARYLVSLWAEERFGAGFPIGTLLVNVSGSFLIALVLQAAAAGTWPEAARLAATVGFLGGFTTYSSFNAETARLLETGAVASAGSYVLATFVGGLAAGWAGLALGRSLFAT